MILARSLAALAGLVLLASILWAAGEASIVESFGRIVADPWGVVTLIDLYAGFVLFAVVVVIVEPVRWVMLLVLVLTPVLGNVVTAAWLVARAPRLLQMLAKTGNP